MQTAQGAAMTLPLPPQLLLPQLLAAPKRTSKPSPSPSSSSSPSSFLFFSFLSFFLSFVLFFVLQMYAAQCIKNLLFFSGHLSAFSNYSLSTLTYSTPQIELYSKVHT